MELLLAQVGQEMERQIAKWGMQDHPSYLLDDVIDVYAYSYVSTERAKVLCDARLGSGECSWQDILNEEVLEARDEAITGNLEALKEELIQVAAVALSWVQSIERNGK